METLLLLLSPFSPHICEELWHMIGHENSICLMSWPKYDKDALVQSEVEMVVQINGKVRDRIMVATGSDDETVRQQCLQSPRVLQQLEGKTVQKFIIVPGKLVNIVAR